LNRGIAFVLLTATIAWLALRSPELITSAWVNADLGQPGAGTRFFLLVLIWLALIVALLGATVVTSLAVPAWALLAGIVTEYFRGAFRYTFLYASTQTSTDLGKSYSTLLGIQIFRQSFPCLLVALLGLVCLMRGAGIEPYEHSPSLTRPGSNPPRVIVGGEDSVRACLEDLEARGAVYEKLNSGTWVLKESNNTDPEVTQ
jgi:hypothetical protein